MTLHLSEQAKRTLEQLEDLAARDDMSLEDLLDRIFSQYPYLFPSRERDTAPAGSPGYKLIEAAKKVNLKGGKDTSSRTRQILEDEYGDYLQRRLSTDAE